MAIAWGHNNYDQCDVPAGETFVQVAAGEYHMIGFRADGTAIAWGDNQHGQCDVPAGEIFVQIAAGNNHNIGLRDYILNVPSQYATIQEAIDAAMPGQIVEVEPGTYTSTGSSIINPGGKAITIRCSTPGAEAVLDGENSRCVIVCDSGESSDTVIEGFRITGGNSTEAGGIYCYQSNPHISDCIIEGNYSSSGGGGIKCRYSDPIITNCIISNNDGLHSGGILISQSNPIITGCFISNNTTMQTDGHGGGIRSVSSSNPVLSDTTLCNNDLDNIHGQWTNGGGLCLSFSCADGDSDGITDECEGSTGDGVHEVPSEYSSIQDAIEAAGYGDTVLVAPGTYVGDGNWVINPGGKPISILASGTPEETILDGYNLRGVVVFSNGETSQTVIEGFTITNGRVEYGGGGILCNSSNPTITNCVIEDNTSTNFGAGGISIKYCSPVVTDCTISGNTGEEGGGVNIRLGNPTFSNCMIENNTAFGQYGHGGGIFFRDSDSLLIDCTISGNMTTGLDAHGGGALCYQSSPEFINCMINSNTCNHEDGGGLYHYYYSNPALAGTTICSNSPDQINDGWQDNGGNSIDDFCTLKVPSQYATIQEAIDAAIPGETVEVEPGIYTSTGSSIINPGGKAITIRCSVPGAHAVLDGENSRRGIFCHSGETAGTLIEGFKVIRGSSPWGGGAWFNSGSSPTLKHCIFEDNTATTTHGGGIYCSNSSNPSLFNCTMRNNSAAQMGGGIDIRQSSPALTGCVIEYNTAGSSGGGMYMEYSEEVTLVDCQISDNTSPSYGGGLCCTLYSTCNLTRCNIFNNDGEDGGGVCIDASAGLVSTFTDCHIHDNAANDDGGGVVCYGSSPILESCSISGNTAADKGGGMYCSSSSSPTFAGMNVCGNGPEQVHGTYVDNGDNCITDNCNECLCSGDTDSDGDVDILDLLNVLDQYSTCTENCSGDVDGDSDVDIEDVLLVIQGWGSCP